MLFLHIGKPRSGKTYDVIRSVILPALTKGRRVLTNIEGMELPECREWIAAKTGANVDQKLVWLDDSAIRTRTWFKDPENNDLFVIDECQVFWPGGSLKPSDPEAFAFMTRHGHYNVDIHLITQSEKNVDSHIRRLCGQTNLYRKMGFIGLSGSYQVQYFNGSEPAPALQISSAVKRYDPEIFRAYKSIVEGADVPTARQANLLTSKKFIVLYAFLLFGLVFTIRSCSKFKDRGFDRSDSDKKSSSSVVEIPNPVRVSAPAPVVRSGLPVVTYTSVFRLDQGITALRLTDGTMKLLPSLPMSGGLFFHDSVFYAPVITRGSDD